MMRSAAVFLLLFLSFQEIFPFAQAEKKTYNAQRVSAGPVVIDGIVDEASWQQMDWEKGFVQHEPYEGKAPSQETGFKILYDDDNIYVAIMAFDNSPDSIVERMTRKDDIEGDQVAIQIDSYFDHRTAFTFIVSAAGVKQDGIWADDGDNQDFTWDPIWYVKTSINGDGWVTEMKIPLSQLRFDKEEQQVWGLQVGRQLHRKDELSLWQPIARDAPGWVHLFGELHGISGVEPKRQVEIAPYVVASVHRFEKEAGNPFATGRKNSLNAGVDGKIGVTNNMILDFTINPDFGQVEADPSEVNLSAFETFFQEKRPFFIEGKSILNFPMNHFDGGSGPENMFYSRRIGRRPQYEPELADNEYMDFPSNTSILGAAKLTGKTQNGLSLGIMESITSKETAEIDHEGDRRFQEVEPLTNYTITRVQKDYNEGNTVIGGMVTTTNRSIDDPQLEFLHKAAYTGGIDFNHNWKDRTYTFMGKVYFSNVRGSQEALVRTQESSARYLQRPDKDYARIDSGRTSLSGHGGALAVGKFAKGHWRYAAFLYWVSPGLEFNDIGFMTQGDRIMQVFWAGYRVWEPVSIFREFNINFNQWTIYDFGGNLNHKGGNINLHAQFKNYWYLNAGFNPEFSGTSNTALRGGPSYIYQTHTNSWINIDSDQRKKFTYGAYSSQGWGKAESSRYQDYGIYASYRPYNALSISLSPSFSWSRNELQYIDTQTFDAGNLYLFGTIDQKTVNMSLRVNFNISPNFTIQYWGQPFVAVGKYADFKKITDPHADEYTDRFHVFSGNEVSYDPAGAVYSVSDGTNPDFTFDDPDFNFKEFKSNFVARWEYVPGSTLYLVWSQGRSGSETNGRFDFGKDLDDLFDIHPDNIFLIKFSYRFIL